MPGIALNDIVEVTWNQRLAGQMVLTYFHYLVTGAGAAPEVGAFSTTLAGAQIVPGGPVLDVYDELSNEMRLISARAQVIKPTRWAYREVFPDVEINGASGDHALPPGVAIAITKQGAGAGRHYHGTLHLAGFPQTRCADGLVNADAIPDIRTAFDFLNLVQTVDGVELTPIIYNADTPGDSFPIDHFTVEETLRTMSRRVVGRGK